MIRPGSIHILLFILTTVVFLSILYLEIAIADVLSVSAETLYPTDGSDGDVLSKLQNVQLRSRHSGFVNGQVGDQVLLRLHHFIKDSNGSIVHDSGER